MTTDTLLRPGADREVGGRPRASAGIAQTDLAALHSTALRLADVVAGVDLDVVLAVVSECYERTADARVQNYRFVLAERAARCQLQRIVSS